MKLKRTKRLFKESLPNWLDAQRAKEGGRSITRLARRLFVPSAATRVETFEQAMQRLSLSQADVMARQSSFFRLFIIMLVVTVIISGYAVYLLLSGHFMASLATWAMVGVAAALTFRNHFWYFQLKQRTLGLSFREWLNKAILGKP